MLKRIVRAALIGAGIFAGIAAVAMAFMQPVWQKPLVNESALAYNNTYSFQTNNARVDNLAFQCIYTSATIASVTFNDGRQSTGTITVSSSPFPVPSSMAQSQVCINNTCLVSGIDWTWDGAAKSSATALSIANAINNNAILNQIVVATAPTNSSVIYTTSTFSGAANNFALYTSSYSAINVGVLISSTVYSTTTFSGGGGTGAMVLGASPQYATGTSGAGLISATNGFTTADPTQAGALGFEVWYSTGSGVGITNLTYGTTYFAIPVSPTSMKVATSLANAKAGTFVVLGSSTPATATHNFTLNTMPIAGTPSFKFEISNDGANWNALTATPYNVAISSVTMLTYTLGGASSVWDFGPFDYTWIRANVIAPTTGGVTLKCTPNGEGQSASY